MNLNYVKEVWHTCPINSGQSPEDLRSQVPFKSKSNYQWLTQGYYFWVDEKHAKDWAVIRKYDKSLVSRFYLTFENEKDIFDLREVKNLEHLSKVIQVVESVYKARNESIPTNIRTVAHGIFLLRLKGADEFFRNVAVLAADSGCVLKKEKDNFWKSKIPFMSKESGEATTEFLHIGRTQLCVFNMDTNPKYELQGILEL